MGESSCNLGLEKIQNVEDQLIKTNKVQYTTNYLQQKIHCGLALDNILIMDSMVWETKFLSAGVLPQQIICLLTLFLANKIIS